MGAGTDAAGFFLPDAFTLVRRGCPMRDALPLLSLLSSVPTLWLFYTQRRPLDLAFCTLGLLIAALYHYLQVCEPGGLGAASFWGLPGAAWRVVDIVYANMLLARSLGHLLGLSHPAIKAIPNIVLPATLGALVCTQPARASLHLFSRLTAGYTLLMVGLQLAVDARAIVRHAVVHFTRATLARTVGCAAAGFACFIVPAFHPTKYWLWHSLWHLCMGLAFFELYAALEGVPGYGTPKHSRAERAHALLPASRTPAGARPGAHQHHYQQQQRCSGAAAGGAGRVLLRWGRALGAALLVPGGKGA